MENGELKLSKRGWWFAVGCVALAVYGVASGIWGAIGAIFLVFAVQAAGGIEQSPPLMLVGSWWMAAAPVAGCAAAWWACLRFAKAAGRPQTEWRGRLALLGVSVGVVAGVMLFNTSLAMGVQAWMRHWVPPVMEYPCPPDPDGSMATRTVSVRVGMGAPSGYAVTRGAEAAWAATSQYLHPEDDPWADGEWEPGTWEDDAPLDEDAAE